MATRLQCSCSLKLQRPVHMASTAACALCLMQPASSVLSACFTCIRKKRLKYMAT